MHSPMGRVRAAGAILTVALVLTGCRKGDKTTAADSTAVRTPVAAAPAFNPSIDCGSTLRDIEKVVCGDTALSSLDQKLGIVYSEAEARQGLPAPAWFVDEQRNWSVTRDACTANSSARACLDSAYTRRIAAIQATSLLVPTKGPVTYSCPLNGDHGEVVAMFADTDPPTVILERGDKSVVAYFVKTASGARYEGANVTFTDKGGVVQVNWVGTLLTCREQAPTS